MLQFFGGGHSRGFFIQNSANVFRMESTGQPGRVHISEKTYQFLTEDYYVQQAEDYNGKSIYQFLTEDYYVQQAEDYNG